MDRNRIAGVITVGIALFFLGLALAQSSIIGTPGRTTAPPLPTISAAPPLPTPTRVRVVAADLTEMPTPVPTLPPILFPLTRTPPTFDRGGDPAANFPTEPAPAFLTAVPRTPRPTAAPTATPEPAPTPTPAVPAVTVVADGESDGLNQLVIGDIKRLDLIYLGIMLAGIVGKVAYDSLKETVGLRKSLATLVIAIIVSPIVYAAVYEQFIRQSLSLEGIGVAFQNGFFWQTVFSEVGKTGQSNTGGGGTQPAIAPQPTGD